jgi:vacuolar-type H+-ATPase subunit H
MMDFVAGIAENTLGSLLSVALIYALGRFLTGVAGQTTGTSSSAERIPSLPRIDAHPNRGAFFPKPRVLLLCLLFGFVVGWVNRPSGLEDGYPRELRDEAQTILDDAHYKAEEIIREAQYRASELMREAAGEEASLRITEQAETAVRVVLLAEEEARRLMETAHHQARTIHEDARQRAQHLLHEADLRLTAPPAPTLGEWLRDQVTPLIIWPLRVVALLALVSFIPGAQTSSNAFVSSTRAALYLSLILAIVDVIVDVSGLAFFVPMFIASIKYAGMQKDLSSGQLLLAAFSLLYQRFGIALRLVALQFVMIAALAGLGSSIGIAIVAIARAAGWEYIIQLGGWLVTIMGISIGISIGKEFGHALATVSFVSVLSGPTFPQKTSVAPEPRSC